MDIANEIIATTVEIFATMVMIEISPEDPFTDGNMSLEESISGVIGLAGTHKGVLAIHTPNEVAFAITGNFLGLEVNEINGDVKDAIGELANMLGGNVKAILSKKGKDIELSLPTTINGEKYSFQCQNEADIVIIPFKLNDGRRFLVELQLENGIN